MKTLKNILDRRITVEITLLLMAIVFPIAIGLLVWLNCEPFLVQAKLFGGLSWFISFGISTILLSKVKIG